MRFQQTSSILKKSFVNSLRIVVELIKRSVRSFDEMFTNIEELQKLLNFSSIVIIIVMIFLGGGLNSFYIRIYK